MTIGIIACIEVSSTSTIGYTTPVTTARGTLSTHVETSTAAHSTEIVTTSGTTTVPTSAHTSTICRKDMAQVGDIYVTHVAYSKDVLQPVSEGDLTSTSGSGISFPDVDEITSFVDSNNHALYYVDISFNAAGVDSLSSIIVNKQSNVDKFRVEFFVPSNPNELVTAKPNLPLSYDSTIIDHHPAIVKFFDDVPSPLSGIRISFLSTVDTK